MAKFEWAQFQKKPINFWLRNPLAEMTQEHCAFCDRFTVEPETVEHFKPKSDPRFLHLAYTWSNLYYCCGGCQKAKREQWNELLLQPDAPDYSFERFFEFDFTTGQIRPNSVAVELDRQRAEITIEIYQLDSPERRRWRNLELLKWQNASNREIDHYGYRNFVESN